MNRLHFLFGRVRSFLRRRGALVGFLILAAGNVVGWHELQQERKDRIEYTCATNLRTRAETRTMWIMILQEAGVEDDTIDILRRGYANLPTPADCQ